MTEPTESTQQLKARIQRQLLERIAELSVNGSMIEPLNFMVNSYSVFISAPTVTFDPDGASE